MCPSHARFDTGTGSRLPWTAPFRSTDGAKLIALFMKPADPKAFGADYDDTQLPLARTLPGLRGYESGLTTTSPGACIF